RIAATDGEIDSSAGRRTAPDQSRIARRYRAAARAVSAGIGRDRPDPGSFRRQRAGARSRSAVAAAIGRTCDGYSPDVTRVALVEAAAPWAAQRARRARSNDGEATYGAHFAGSGSLA